MDEKETTIEFSKKYALPKNLTVKYLEDKILVISPESANWIVLTNKNQLGIFNELCQNSIEEVTNKLGESVNEEDIVHVLTELEAKEFENQKFLLPQRNGICIYLTNECNLRCKHCYMNSGKRMGSELTTDEIANLLFQFQQKGGQVATFTGGEISLRNDLPKIVQYSKKLGLTNILLTNGVVWDTALVNSVLEYIDEFQVSIDGYDEQTNAKIRGKGTFNKALHTLDIFVRNGIKVFLAITPMYEDLSHHKDAYISFAKSLITKYSENKFYVKFNYELLQGRDVNINREQNQEYKAFMDSITEACYPGSLQNEFVLNHQHNTVFENCGYGELTISAIGDVYYCNRLSELKSYGNIRNDSFETIYEQCQIAKALSNVNNLKPCSNCDLKYICGGGCRITYFKDLIELEYIDSQSYHHFRPRKCSIEIKEKFYKLMIDTNKDFYR